jgi:AraC-like DNA-binding protein
MAVHLLQEDTLSVTDIAHELGYSNVAHFSRAFSRVTGMSPRTYRGLLKK